MSFKILKNDKMLQVTTRPPWFAVPWLRELRAIDKEGI